MQNHASDTSKANRANRTKTPRARSLPHVSVFHIAIFFIIIHYLGILASVTTLICLVLEPSELASRVLVAGIVFSAFSWLLAFFKRRAALCPLCRGTPLIKSGAHTHQRARRLYPLGYGTTATISIMTTQKFRCMYCGTDYDLLKPQKWIRTGEPSAARDFAQEEYEQDEYAQEY